MVENYIQADNLVDGVSVGTQIRCQLLLDKCYNLLKNIILYRIGIQDLPSHCYDDKRLQVY